MDNQRSLVLLFGLRQSLVLPLLVSASLLLTSGCGVNPLSFLGGGPNVAANVPVAVGKNVEQTQGISIKTGAPSVSVRPEARVDSIDQSTTNNTTVDPWLVILLIIGWLLPSPNEMGRWFIGLFKRK